MDFVNHMSSQKPHPALPFQSYKSIVIFGIVSFVVAHICAKVLVWFREAQVRRQLKLLKEMGKDVPRIIPLTLVTGYLGAGKTTLCNHLLSTVKNKRIAMIVNELGEISIDHELLAPMNENEGNNNNVQGVYLLKNGCICCSTAETKGISEMERVLRVLTELVRSNEIDHVVVETSGMADPGPLIRLLYELQVDGGAFKLDGVITVVDAKHLEAHQHETEPFEQVLSADLIIINKVELVHPEQLLKLKRFLRRVNPTAQHIETNRAKVSASVLNQAAFSVSALRTRREQAKIYAASIVNEKSNVVETHSHTSGIEAVCLEEKASPLDWDAFDNWLDDVVSKNWKNLYRVKGILCFDGRDKTTVIHGVHADIESGYGQRIVPFTEESTWSRLVLIGKNLDAKRLRSGFASTVVKPKES